MRNGQDVSESRYLIDILDGEAVAVDVWGVETFSGSVAIVVELSPACALVVYE